LTKTRFIRVSVFFQENISRQNLVCAIHNFKTKKQT